jgi:outer membrane protein TolC
LAFAAILAVASPCRVVAGASLAEMVQAAVDRQPDQGVAAAERDIATALQVKANQLLAADPAFNIKYQTDAVGSGNGYREWEGGVDLPLWWPGQSQTHRREAERTLAVSDAMREATVLAIAGEVRERLWAVGLAGGERDQARSALTVARELAHDVQRRVAAGELPRSDRVLAEQELLLREDALQQAETRLEAARRLFASYTGLEPPGDPLPEPRASGTGVGSHHPRLRLVDASVERAKAHRDRVGAERRRGPNLWLGAKTQRPDSRLDYDSSVGVEVSLPLGSRAHAAPDLAEAEAALTRAQVEQTHTRRELEEAWTQALLELERTEQALARAERRTALGDEGLRLSRRAFDLGETDLVRLLQAQADALDARHDAQIRGLEYARAMARLNQALGVVPQ